MRRLFFSLYAVVVAALLAFVVATPWLVEHGLRGELLRGGQQVAAAAQYLFEQELRPVPVDRWPAHIEQLKSKFGYDVSLLRMNEIEASQESLRHLRQGRAEFAENNPIDFVLLPIKGSDYVVKVYVQQQPREHAQRTMEGFYYLLEKLLGAHPQAEHDNVLAQLEQRFSIPLRSLALEEALTRSERERLRSGEIVGFDVDQLNERYFKRLGVTQHVLQVGPFPSSFVERAIEYIAWALLALTVAVAIYLWVRPLWRDMLALDQGALALGLGKLDTRVQVSTRSPIRALANTFNGMAQRVQELLKSQKEMADAISHELRTPISRLRFGVEMLEHTAAPGDRDRYMKGILRDVNELDRLVDESLTYSRLTNSSPRLSLRQVVLAQWLEEIMEDARRSAGAISLRSEIDNPAATASFDPQLMARALQNIVRNSLRYAQATVKVTIHVGDAWLDLIVEDDGPGIAPEHRQVIFAPFYRIDSSRQRESGGHGLGLAIVKRICEWHDAEVTVAEATLGGALFRLRLPLRLSPH